MDNNSLQIITNGDLNQYVKQAFESLFPVLKQGIKLEVQEATQKAIEKFEDKYKPYMDKMENTTQNAQKAIERIGVRKKQSHWITTTIKEYLGIRKIEENKYDYERIKRLFLSELSFNHNIVIGKLEDIPITDEYMILLDEVCKKLCPRNIVQFSLFDEVIVSEE